MFVLARGYWVGRLRFGVESGLTFTPSLWSNAAVYVDVYYSLRDPILIRLPLKFILCRGNLR